MRGKYVMPPAISFGLLGKVAMAGNLGDSEADCEVDPQALPNPQSQIRNC